MSINKIFLKELKELKKDYKKDPESFKNKIKKADALIGPNDSVLFAEKIKELK